MSNFAVMSIVVPMGEGTPEQADLITNEIEKVISKATEGMYFYSDVGFLVVPDPSVVPLAAGISDVLRGIAAEIEARMARANQAPPTPDAVLIRGGQPSSEWDLIRRRASGEDISKA
jgi:hypothetical protein|uniref:Uncharacterized protein n=1 Tax=uncultured marine virus TaxID=186617 RepID=A0A0F7L8D5_9VIRU|nr:hypothetical protein [uncultured marine virus]